MHIHGSSGCFAKRIDYTKIRNCIFQDIVIDPKVHIPSFQELEPVVPKIKPVIKSYLQQGIADIYIQRIIVIPDWL